ncbi:MAG: hypothetical protein L7H00_00385 [Vulcanisaeta sp.]|nr:hypothetical protein [Vulcanisaeta sp.]MCG2891967.1 hypothetical protein [Vulcanisaeta sp.]MCG2895199.1 hypothetical protein [Vulcanisaeta sp.]
MVSEILQALLPYLGFGVFAIPVLVYGAVKYAHGPTPEVRREGLDLMLDVLVGSVMFGVLTALISSNFFTQAVQWVALSVSVGNHTLASVMPDASNPQQLLGWSADTAYQYFNNVTAAYGHFWGTTIGLSIIPVTSPFGWYLQQSTWYLQTMITYTIINLGFIYALSLIAEYAWVFMGIATGLLLIRQTRSIGTFIIALALIALFIAPLLTAYTITYLGPVVYYLSKAFLVKPSLSSITNFLNTLWNQGYPAGLVMQTYDVTVDVVLAFALAASYGLYRVLDETIVDVLPI